MVSSSRLSRRAAFLFLVGVAWAGCSVETAGLGAIDGGGLDGRAADARGTDARADDARGFDTGPAPFDAGPGCDPLACDDGNPCTDDRCGASGCESVPNTAPCEDDVFCNGSEVCAGGACTSPGDPCVAMGSLCDETAGVCVECLDRSHCPDAVPGAWSTCTFSSECDESGEAVRTVTDYQCEGGRCTAIPLTEPGTCTRDTDGMGCPRDGRSCTDDVCIGGRCEHPCRRNCSCSVAGCSCWG